MGDAPSSSLDLSAVKKGSGIKSAVAAIDRVHGFARVNPPILVVYDASLLKERSQGRIRANAENGRPEIAILPGNPPSLESGVFTHEFGHLFDLTLTGQVQYASENRFAPLMSWQDAIASSESFQRLVQVNNDPAAKPTDRGFAKYLLKHRELFARSYAQYVAGRSSSDDLRLWLEVMSGEAKQSPLPEQWTEEDFMPIAAAFDSLLREVKYKK